ncbi:DNA-binding pseudobarrel domain-containing protein [Tanacetum coccineum]|uniref:DNA-binding pseudobarrel domain-containing protein n=1 Tax=Tanacetum coccineum TaxID=301880 RepID=A0ABQ5FQC0_9ASTR
MVPSKPPSFFKVLVDPSTSNLPLPPDFVTMYFKNKIPNDPIIQSLNGEHAWGLKIKKDPIRLYRIRRFPGEFVGLGKIEGEGPIMMKGLDGKEWPMVARLDKSYQAERFYSVKGWRGFRRSNGLKEGDECVFKFITSERKICLAKVTRKKRLPIQPCQDGSGTL